MQPRPPRSNTRGTIVAIVLVAIVVAALMIRAVR